MSSLLFPVKAETTMSVRSSKSENAKLPVPGYSTLAANLMARAWSEAPNLESTSTLSAAT